MIGLILAAAGTGSRFGAEIPKQFLNLKGQPVFVHSLRRFAPLCEEAIVVVPEGSMQQVTRQVGDLTIDCRIRVVAGGEQRQDSVLKGLQALRPEIGLVLVHDAARPFISENLIRRVIEGTLEFSACVPGLPIPETVKEVDDSGEVVRTLDRRPLRLVQTPQGYRREILEKAFTKAGKEGFYGTDEASLVERLGFSVRVIDGEAGNLKLTWQEDLAGH